MDVCEEYLGSSEYPGKRLLDGKSRRLPDISARRPDEHLEGALLGDPSRNSLVIVPDSVLVQADGNVPRLIRFEEHLFKRHKLLLRPWQPTLLIVNIQLHRLCTGATANV